MNSSVTCKIELNQAAIKPYVAAMKEAKHYVEITRHLVCDPRSSDPSFCQKLTRDQTACCMKFDFDEEEAYSHYATGFLNDYGYHTIDYMGNLTGSLPIDQWSLPVHLCSSTKVLKDTHSIYISEFEENRAKNGGIYKIGLDLLPDKQGFAQCTV